MGRKNTNDLHVRRFPGQLWIQLRKACLDRGVSAREFMIEAIRKAVEENE